METIIKIEKEDVNTSMLGVNYSIKSGNISIVFSQAAVEEFIKDVKEIQRNDEIEFIRTKLFFNQTVIYKGQLYHFIRYDKGDVWISQPANSIEDARNYEFPVRPEELFLKNE